MKLALFALAGASLVTAGAAEAYQADPRFNAASGYSRGYVTQGTPVPAYSQGRVQSWYSDTGWQPGMSALGAYGYGYGYGGAGAWPPVIVAAPYPGAIYSQPAYQVQRSQPLGYVVDGYGRYPWSRTAVHGGQAHSSGHGHGCNCGQAHAQGPAPQPVHYSAAPVHVRQPPIHVQSPPIHVEAAQVHVAPTTVEVAPPRIHYDQGYFAVPADTPPPPPPPSPTERPYLQEPGERG